MNITRIGEVRCKVGEGPVWDVAEQALYFVDVLGQDLWRHDPASGAFDRWHMPTPIGSMALCQNGGAVVALQDGLHRLDLQSGRTTPLAIWEDRAQETQCNDGKVDPRGRFLVGTVPRSLHDERDIGVLRCIHPNGTVEEIDHGFNITNGPAWSPDGKTFYFSNSRAHLIFAYDYDLDRGQVSNRRLFADTTVYGGMPDGATVDTEGRLWSAICGGGKVVCWRPDGQVDRVIEMPVPLVGSVMFGGPQLDRLYVTTLDGGALGLGLPQDGLGGSLFAIDGLGATGLPEQRMAV